MFVYTLQHMTWLIEFHPHPLAEFSAIHLFVNYTFADTNFNVLSLIDLFLGTDIYVKRKIGAFHVNLNWIIISTIE